MLSTCVDDFYLIFVGVKFTKGLKSDSDSLGFFWDKSGFWARKRGFSSISL